MAVILAGYMAAVVITAAIVFAFLFYRTARKQLMQELDARLYAAAYMTRDALPHDFHDRLQDSGSLSRDAYNQIIDRHNGLCRELGLQYVWSCLLVDGNIVFTTATSPSHNLSKGDHARFFDLHRDPKAFDGVFGTMQVDYRSFQNEWGHGRMVLIPFRDSHDRPYCFGASMSIDHVRAAQHALLLRTAGRAAWVTGLAILGALLLSRRITRRIRSLTRSADEIREGSLDGPIPAQGPAEIRQLANALNAMHRQITENIAALTAARDEHQQLLTNLGAGVVIHSPDTHITYCNPEATRLLGLTSDQMLGRKAIDPAWSFLREDDNPMEQADYPVNRVVASREPLKDYVVGINHPDRPNRTWVLVNAFPEFEADESLHQIVVTFIDITAIRRLESQLLMAQKMEAVGQLAGGVAHDFNNILQAIGGYAQLAREDTSKEHPAHEALAEIITAADRAANVVKQLLAFSRRQLLEPTCIQMNDVIRDLVGMLHRVIGEHIELDFVPGHHLGVIEADRTMIEQVLLNLSVNARDAMPQGGHLSIETENVFLDQAYCEHNLWARTGRYVLISVTDTGSGMEAATLDHIFEPFFTTKGEGEGTGLGLATVYGVVRQHDGMVRVYSEVGRGTSFKVYLPVVERPVDAVGSKIEGPLPQGTETILVAEDDKSIRRLVKRMLERGGYTVLTAANGQEALDVYREQRGSIDLLLLDVVMPVMGGREVFNRVREEDSQVPIIFASGYSQNAIHTNFILQSGMQLLHKPYNTLDLLRRVRDVLDHE